MKYSREGRNLFLIEDYKKQYRRIWDYDELFQWIKSDLSRVHQVYMKNIQDEKIFEYNYKKYTFFKPGEEEEFMEHFNSSNSMVAKEFLGREDGRLFYDDIKDYPEYQVDTYQLLCDVILVYGRMVNLLNEKCEAQLAELNALKPKVKEEKAQRIEKDAELRARIVELEQTSLWFRLRRKWRHITGKDAQ